MAEKKTETKDTQKQISELELRVAKLEAKHASGQLCGFGELFKDGRPSQDDVRDWIKANPFMALGLAVVVTLLLAAIF